jgi:hypothetical protein
MEFGGFVGPAYQSRSIFQDCQQSINLYPEIDPTPGAKSVMALMPTPGLEAFLDLPTLASITARPVRLLYVPASRPELAIAAVGNILLTIIPAGSGYTIANFTLSSNNGPMTADDNGTDIIASDGVNGYSINIATLAVAKISDPAYFGGYALNLDGYFVLNKPDTPQFYISGLRALTFDGLDFATKEAEADDIARAWTEHRDLWLLGTNSSEVWYNTGNGDFPFERNSGAFMQHGCAAVHSISRLGETFAFLATDERGAVTVVIAEGYNIRPISTTALDYEMSRYEQVNDAIGFSYRMSGHEFYQLTFPTANKTWVYDLKTNMWHQRASLDAKGVLNRHRANCSMNYRGRIIVGDYKNGKLYEYKDEVYTDGGDEIPRIRRCPHILDDRKMVRFQEVQIEFQPGVGLQTGQGEDPQAMLRWSDDGGETWGNEHWVTIGAVGHYKNRARWTRLGAARDRVFEVRVSDPVKAVIIGATLNVRGGA